MKNFKLKSYITIFVLAILGASCDDYLEEAPDNRLELDTVEKAAKVVAEAYSQASYVYTDFHTDYAGPVGFPDANGIIQTTGGNSINQRDSQIYLWETVTDIFQDTPTYYWDNAYEAISQTNEVLAIIDGLEGDEKRKRAVKGEALLSRAYHHFMLVNIFGLHYDENASSNLGVPYILAPETEFLPTYKRNTVAEVYDLVEKDLLEGLSLIDDSFFIGTKKYHFTKKAAQAFASRFYLWKKDYANCIKYSDLALAGSPQTFIKDYGAIPASNYQSAANFYGDPADASNLLVMQQFTWYARRANGYRPNNTDVTALFQNPLSSADTRTNINGWRTGGTNARYASRLFELFFRENLSSNTGQGYYIAVELKGEEILLNRAEAHLMQGDQNAALVDINILASDRYSGNEYTDVNDIINFYSPVDPATSLPILLSEQDAILELILHERKKEFWDHGLRWFDIKRHNIPVTHVVPVTEGGGTFELTANDLRKAAQIPADALAFGLTPNPR